MGPLPQEIVKSKEIYSDFLETSGELQSSLSLDGDVQVELEMLQQTIENIKNNLQEAELIKEYESDTKVIQAFQKIVKSVIS